MNLLLWMPILSLFSLKSYRKLQTARAPFIFIYPAYLTFLFAIATMIVLCTQFLPLADEFMDWLGKNLPAMTLTADGIQMSHREPVLLIHPDWGPVLYLDPNNDFPREEDAGKALVLLARRKIAFYDPVTREMRMQTIPGSNTRSNQSYRITGAGVIVFWKKIRASFLAASFLLFWAAIYILKLLGAFSYSALGLLINYFRPDPLPYRAVMSTTLAAMTPFTLVQILAGPFETLRLVSILPVSIILTGFYLCFALFATREPRVSFHS